MSFLQLSQILCGSIHSAVNMVLERWDESRNAYSSRFTVNILRHRPQNLVFSAAAHGHVASSAHGKEHRRDEEHEADAERTWAEILEAKMPQVHPVMHASSGETESFVQEFFHEGFIVHDRRVGDESIVQSVDSSGHSLEWSLQGRRVHGLEAKGAELRRRELTLTTSPPSSPTEEALKKPSGIQRGKAGERGAGHGEQEGVSTPPQVFAQQADRLDRLSLVVHSVGSSHGCYIHQHKIFMRQDEACKRVVYFLNHEQKFLLCCIRAWWMMHARTQTHARTHARTQARTRTHTHTHKQRLEAVTTRVERTLTALRPLIHGKSTPTTHILTLCLCARAFSLSHPPSHQLTYTPTHSSTHNQPTHPPKHTNTRAWIGDLEHWRNWPTPLALPEIFAENDHEGLSGQRAPGGEKESGFEEGFGGVAGLRSRPAEMEMFSAFPIEAGLGCVHCLT